MNSTKHIDKDHEEFSSFLNAPETLPSRELDLHVLTHVKEKLNPAFSILLFKLSLIHGFIGAITLLFCPQFELSLTANQEMFHIFHRLFGYYGCLAACGCIFLGSGALFASLLLNRDEVRVINSKFYAFFPSLAVLSLGIFFAFGAKLFIDIILAWSLGGIIGSAIIFYLSNKLQLKIKTLA